MKIHASFAWLFALQILMVDIFSVHAAPGSKLWEYPTGAPILSSPALSSSGIIYVGSYDQALHAVHASDGTQLWKYSLQPTKPTQSAYVYSSPAVAPDGTIYFGTEERDYSAGGYTGTFYALNPGGTLKWKFPVSSPIYSDPAIGADGTVYFGCFDTNLYALNLDGTQKWKFKAGNTIFSDVVIAADGTIYFGCDDHNLYALTPAGTKKWTFDTGGPVTTSPAIGSDGTVYVGSTTSFKFFALNPDGSKKWEFLTGERIYSSAALALDGTIYFGSNDRNLYALHADGTLKWQFLTSDVVRSSPAIATDGTVYVGSDDGMLHAVSAAGTSSWSFPTSDYIYSSPVLGSNGTVYVASANNILYAVDGSTGLASTAWPMFRHDVLHTGRAAASVANPTNHPPVLNTISDRTIDENTAFTLTASASDQDIPAQTLTFSLSSPPTGASIGATTGVLTWTPTESQGPGTYAITVIVADNGTPSLTATQTFSVQVREVNAAPVLTSIPDKTVQVGATLSFTIMATDSDIPTNRLTFALTKAPVGAQIDAISGLFTWSPVAAQANSTNLVTVSVSDNGSPSLSAQSTFNVIVTPGGSAPPPEIQSARISNGAMTLVWTAVPGRTYRVQYTSILPTTSWIDLPGDVIASGPTTSKEDITTSQPARFYRIALLP